MASAIGLKPNHYAVLGVPEDASATDIERAFLAKVSPLNPHAFGQVADASVAYQTLKDPGRRRAYDRLIGIGAPPKPLTSKPLWSGQTWSMRASPGGSLTLVQPSARSADSEPEAPVAAPAIASEPPHAPSVPLEAPPVAPVAAAEPTPPVAETPPARLSAAFHNLEFADIEEQDNAGRRTALIIAGAIAAVGLGGALLGWSAGGDPESANAVTVEVPRASASEPSAIAVDELLVPPGETVGARPRSEARRRSAARPLPAVADAVPAPTAAIPPPAPPTLTGEPETAVEAPPSDAPGGPSGGAMPLSNRTIARTIERIGYACGSVSSAVPQGAGGVYTVNCSSGHAYRAAPIGGRYRFKRIAG